MPLCFVPSGSPQPLAEEHGRRKDVKQGVRVPHEERGKAAYVCATIGLRRPVLVPHANATARAVRRRAPAGAGAEAQMALEEEEHVQARDGEGEAAASVASQDGACRSAALL